MNVKFSMCRRHQFSWTAVVNNPNGEQRLYKVVAAQLRVSPPHPFRNFLQVLKKQNLGETGRVDFMTPRVALTPNPPDSYPPSSGSLTTEVRFFLPQTWRKEGSQLFCPSHRAAWLCALARGAGQAILSPSPSFQVPPYTKGTKRVPPKIG